MHVFADQSAYILAAGSSLAKSPTSLGLVLSLESPSATSASSPFATVPARNTLQWFADSLDAIVEVMWLRFVGLGRFGIEVVAYKLAGLGIAPAPSFNFAVTS